MEGLSLKGMPQFKTPEEELMYLRAQVASREKQLMDEGRFENTPEAAARDVIAEYKKIPLEQAVHPAAAMSKEETEEIVLALKPETHDSVMAELLGVVLEKGIKNALSVAEAMDNPHIDDDFHRVLIQYLKTGKVPFPFKEDSPLYKSFHMTLFEITLPPPEEEKDKSKNFKEFIGAMEQFYAGMNSISLGKNNKFENYFAIEIALSNDSDEVIIYAAVPDKFISLFEKQILAYYHAAKVREVKDDYNIFAERGAAVGAYAELSERAALPLKTYDNIEHDPMNTILNVFSKLATEGEGAAIQLVIAPAGEKYINEFHAILDDVKGGMSVKHAADNLYKFNKAFLRIGKDVIFGVKDRKPEDEKDPRNMAGRRAVDEGAAEKIGNKLKSSIMKADIRIIASAETKERADSILREIESSFNQFTKRLRIPSVSKNVPAGS